MVPPAEPPDARTRLERSLAEGERAYAQMYDCRPYDLKDHKDDALFHLGDALELARQLGLADRITEIERRMGHIRQVYRQLST